MKRGLEALGRRATTILALGLFVGLAIPPLAAAARPLLPLGVALPLFAALAGARGAPAGATGVLEDALGFARERPGLIALVAAWQLAGAALSCAAIAPLAASAELARIVVLTAACPPLMAAPALAAILGLDTRLALSATLIASALAPLWLPFVAAPAIGFEVEIASVALALRLALLVFGCWAAAALWRRARPFADDEAALRGVAVIGLLLFAIAVMDGAARALIEAPEFLAARLAAAFALSIGLQAITAALFWRALGARTALTIALLAGNNNIGLVLAGTAEVAPAGLLAYVAMAQAPIYLLPAVQSRLYSRWTRS